MEAERAEEKLGGRDDSGFRAAVAALMARIVAGERSAVWELHTVAEASLRHMLRTEARRLDIRIGDDDLLDLTLDAAIDLGKFAHAWDPNGALPWVWAGKRINALVHGHIGTFADELDESHFDLVEPSVVAHVDDPRGLLRSLARRHPAAGRLEQRLTTVASERDAGIWLDVQLEKAAGNRSPAVTVAVNHDMRPEAVRKVVQRVTERMEAAA